MSKLTEWGRWVWLEAKLGCPPWLQRTLIPALLKAKDYARLALLPYLELYQWQGQGHGGSLAVNYAGPSDAIPFLKDILFAEKPTQKRIGRVPLWRLKNLAQLPSGDITIVIADKRVAQRLSDDRALILPNFVKIELDVQGEWQDVEGRFRKSVRYERRLVRKYGYECETSHAIQDFNAFYRDMYLPTMEIRHGDRAVPMSQKEACQHFRRGFLFLIRREGRAVCGSVCYVEQNKIHFILMGVLGGDQELMKEGAVGALNYLRLQWANQNGFSAVDFGWYRPVMLGMFLNKRKWSPDVHVPPAMRDRIWLKLRHNTPAVRRFMHDTPLIVMDQKHQLYGLITTDATEKASGENKAAWRKKFEIPGLQGIVVRSMDDFFERPTPVVSADSATTIVS